MNAQKLNQVYQDLSTELNDLSIDLNCKACGDCCDFRVFDHIPYVTNFELQFIRSELTKNSELLNQASKQQDPKLCVFYHNKKCIAHQLRPLSCRIFFCNPEYEKEFSSQIYEKYHKKIKELHRNSCVEYFYTRLVEALKQIVAELNIRKEF